MKNLKVVQFLAALTPLEFAEFDKYVHSPYFHTHKGTIDLFDELKKYYPDFPKAEVEKRKVFKALFPDSKYDEKKIYDLGLYLHRLQLQFMAFYQMQKNQHIWEPIMLISSLEDHNLQKQMPKFFEDAEKQLAGISHQDQAYFYYKYLFSEKQCNQILQSKYRTAEVPLQMVAEQLDFFVLLAKLELAISFANKVSIMEGEENKSLIEESFSLYHRIEGEKPISIQLFYFVLKMLTEDDGQEFFQKMKALLPLCSEILPKFKIYRIYLYGINFCSRMMKKGNLGYTEEMFALYNEMLEKQLLFFLPTITNINFKNVVTISIRLKKYAWVKNFIKNYQSEIPTDYRESIVNYSLASLHFAQQKYSEAKRLLIEMKFIDPFYRLSNDILLLKIFYETGELDTLFARSRAFTTFIQRNKTLAEANKTAYSNMAKFVRKLAKVKYERKRNLPKIMEEFEQTQYLVERNWLGEKIKELS